MYVVKGSNKEYGVNKSVEKEKRLKIMARLCHGKVLEFGCGNGTSSAVIRNHGLVVGVDINGEKINEAKQNYSDISFIQSDVLNLAFSPETFDTVVLPEILEHVSEEAGDRMLKIAWKLLKQSGRLIVSVPNDNCIPHINHIRQFKKRSLHSILQKYGEPKLVIEQPYKWLMMYVDKK
jgi:2-polyprenyl-3-methyl-5-hydroxy-6-metoxy-1,4-benzoquinol methylase